MPEALNKTTSDLSLPMEGGVTRTFAALGAGYVEKVRANGSERLKLVGKHSKDKNLSLYVMKRTIYEFEKDGRVENLSGVLRISQAHADLLLEKNQVVVIGVLGRLTSDFGLQLGDYTVYQQETQIFPRLQPEGAVCSQGHFDFDNTFITGLAASGEDYHLQFSLQLPGGMPPSVQLAAPTSGSSPSESWGLVYYLFAYVTSASAVESVIKEQHEGELFWTKLRHGRRHSKTFLSFAKIFVHDHERLTEAPPVAEASKESTASKFFGKADGSACLRAMASLNQPAYCYGDIMSVQLRMWNPRKTAISGIRINVKQLLTIRVGADPKTVTKSCLARYSFGTNNEELHENGEGLYHPISSQLQNGESFCETFRIRPCIDPLRFLYQLALTSTLPRSEMTPPILAANLDFDGIRWPLGGGLERLRLLKIEYYMNIHVVLPWGKNLMVKLPFRLVNVNSGNAPNTSLAETALDSPIFTIPPPAELQQNQRQLSEAKRKDLEALRDLRPIPNNLITLAAPSESASPGISPTLEDRVVSRVQRPQQTNSAEPPFPTNSSSAGSLRDDVIQAKSLLGQLRTKLADEQRIVVDNPLDSRSLSLHFDQRRLVLVKEFLGCLDDVLNTSIPRLWREVNSIGFLKASANNLADFDPIMAEGIGQLSLADHAKVSSGFVLARYLVRSLVGRLGMFHSQLVQFQQSKARRGDRLEQLNEAIDCLELALSKLSLGLAGQHDDSGNRVSAEMVKDTLSRLQDHCKGLVAVIPHYEAFEGQMARLKTTITAYGWADGSQGRIEQHGSDRWAASFDEIVAQMALAFEKLTATVESPSVCGPAFIKDLSTYIDTLLELFEAVPSLSDRIGITVFWQWHFLHALLDAYYLGAFGGPESPLLFPGRHVMAWHVKVRAQIPSQWERVSTETASNRLLLLGNRVIAAMQQLVDSRES